MKSIWSRSNAAARLTWLLSTLLAALLAGCTGVDPVVEIGLVAPFEGRYREIGYDVIYSGRLAVREVNAAGGVGPYRIELVALDDFGQPEMARRTAEALVVDRDVVAVIGHWLPETTVAAAPAYEAAGLAFVAAGEGALGPYTAQDLPAEFQVAYESVTPFDEEAGPYAGAAYDGLYLIIEALRLAVERDGGLGRGSVRAALEQTTIEGITGTVSGP